MAKPMPWERPNGSSWLKNLTLVFVGAVIGAVTVPLLPGPLFSAASDAQSALVRMTGTLSGDSATEASTTGGILPTDAETTVRAFFDAFNAYDEAALEAVVAPSFYPSMRTSLLAAQRYAYKYTVQSVTPPDVACESCEVEVFWIASSMAGTERRSVIYTVETVNGKPMITGQRVAT